MTKYPVLSKTPDKKEYLKYMYKNVRFGRRIVKVSEHTSTNRQGSYERGFKFSERKYGILIYEGKTGIEYTADHGITWIKTKTHADRSSIVKRTKKNRVILGNEVHPELAFDAIQQINRKYEGPGYKWTR